MTLSRYFLFAILLITIPATACGRFAQRREATEPIATPAGGGNYKAGDYVESIAVAGETRRYRLHVPPNYQPGKALPLVINIHGFSSFGEQQENLSKMSVKANQAGFIAVHPEGIGNPQEWRFGPASGGQADLQFFRDLVHQVSSELSVDANRVYTTGISNGAQMTDRLGCTMADTFAAIAPVAGGYFRAEECKPSRPVPVMAFHGTADNLLPYDGRPPLMLPIREWAADWASRNGCNPTPKVTYQKGQVNGETWSSCRENADVVLFTINGGGHSWPGSDMPASITTKEINATDAMWDFFTVHHR